MKFCTHCDKALKDGEKCACQPNKKYTQTLAEGKFFCVKLLRRMGIGTPGENSSSVFETGQKICPDIAKANEGEVPVKQYDVAFLRSRIRGQYAKGRLQVTNKRVIFRAAGMSYQGPIAQQYEFALAEIAGIEVKRKNRISILNILFSFILNSLGVALFSGMFRDFASEAPTFAMFVSVIVALASAVPFFVLHKKFWIKLMSLCAGFGALMGTSGLANISGFSLLYGIETNFADYVGLLLYILWLLNVVLVSVVPDLVLTVKTKGGSSAFEIRRKLFPTPFRQQVEYTDFSEVLPGKDIDIMTTELGALIDDLQTIGDAAIENWAGGSKSGGNYGNA